MIPGEWRLEYPGTVLSMGGFDPITNPFRRPMGVYHRTPPQVGQAELVLDDQPRPRMDGVAFGQDYHGGRTITFELGISAASPQAALALEAQVAAAWRGDTVRNRPQATARLSTYNGGQERTTYGRPRRYSADRTDLYAGRIRITCDFATTTDLWYSTLTYYASVAMVPPPSGGFIAPFVSPITTTSEGQGFGACSVASQHPVWPVVTINGPTYGGSLINPVVRLVGLWDLQVLASVTYGDGIRIDTRPWVRTIRRLSDGASLAGKLTRRSRLDRASIPPGTHQIALLGTDTTGTSKMTFGWNAVYSSLGGEFRNPDQVTRERSTGSVEGSP